MLAEAQEAADIGAQFGDLVVWRSQDCRNFTDVLCRRCYTRACRPRPWPLAL